MSGYGKARAILAKEAAATQAARVAVQLVAATNDAMTDAGGEGWKRLGDAARWGHSLTGLCAYVQMFENRGS